MQKQIVTLLVSFFIVSCASVDKVDQEKQSQAASQEVIVDLMTVSIFDMSEVNEVDGDRLVADKATVKAIQTELTGLGYKLDGVDGIAGEKTSSAIERFQRDFEIAVNGQATPLLLKQLQLITTDKSQGIYAQVSEIQELLIKKGFMNGKADGVAGEKTRESISAYQQDKGFEVNSQLTVGLLDALRAG